MLEHDTVSPPPFVLIYVAPDIAGDLESSCLAHPPIFAGDRDALLVYFRGQAGVSQEPEGRVRAIHRAGAVALVEVDHLRYEADPAVAALLLVRADSLPPAPSLAGRLREQYGDALTMRQVAAAGVVTNSAVFQALRRGRIQGTKQGDRWTFTPEQAAAWLVGRG